VRPESRRLLFLDDDPSRAEAFLGERPEAVWVKTVEECVCQLKEKWDEVHLDHDLGGKQFVDTDEVDCGMEVIRWLCSEPRPYLRRTLFYVHTHNTMAGLLMVLQMRECGYRAEFRPFGVDFSQLAAFDPVGHPNGADLSAFARGGASSWLSWIRAAWSCIRGRPT
jgi:hypothetical protein